MNAQIICSGSFEYISLYQFKNLMIYAMNIFIFSTNPLENVKLYSDVHLRVLGKEICQILCAVHHNEGIKPPNEIPYKSFQPTNPLVKWVEASIHNYKWCAIMLLYINIEYFHRFSKPHHSEHAMTWLRMYFPCLPDKPMLPFLQVMPDKYKKDTFGNESVEDCNANTIIAYMDYVRNEKQGFYRSNKRKGTKTWVSYKWTNREKPEFMIIN